MTFVNNRKQILITKYSHFELKNIVLLNQEIEFRNTLKTLLCGSPHFPHFWGACACTKFKYETANHKLCMPNVDTQISLKVFSVVLNLCENNAVVCLCKDCSGLLKSAIQSSGTSTCRFPSRQVPFCSHLPDGKWIPQAVCQLNH